MLLLSAVLLALASSTPAADPIVTANDNTRAAGRLASGVLTVDLDIVRGMWHPLGADRAGTSSLAFAERGGAPTTPGPLLRVRAGTRIRLSLRNTSVDTIAVHGLAERGGAEPPVPLLVLPGTTVRHEFLADVQGTYYYWGARPGTDLRDRVHDDAMLTGALIVDPAEGVIPPDRILVMDILEEPEGGEVLAINGRPWPYTERMTATVGDSIRWRIINSSARGHPMHLHGFYFRVDAAGDWQQDTVFHARHRRMAVTENMRAGSTRDLVWSPDRPGGWLFHCHLSFHVGMNTPLGTEWTGPEAHIAKAILDDSNEEADHHVEHHMGGLMLLTNVQPAGPIPAPVPATRRIRLEVIASAGTDLLTRRYGYRLAGSDGPLEPGPAPLLVLQRDEPTDIVIINRSPEFTSIHWHGMEIDSYSDGVIGVGGYAHMPTPPIMPADSFVARITAPRSGSFMYHTHVHDIRQQGKGLAGALLVVDDRAAYDPSRERVFLAQRDQNPASPGTGTIATLNRQASPTPDTVQAGVEYRLRFMNLTLANGGFFFRYVSDQGPALWTTVAKDGFDLPPWRQDTSPDRRPVSIGETLDVLWTPAPNSSGWLELRGGAGFLVLRQRFEVIGGPGN